MAAALDKCATAGQAYSVRLNTRDETANSLLMTPAKAAAGVTC